MTTRNNLHYIPIKEQKYYTHINWGGNFWIQADKRSPNIRVEMMIKPTKWDLMKQLGWKKVVYLPIDDILYFRASQK